MFHDQDRFSSDIFQRRIGEESDSNDDSDILDEQIQYNIQNNNETKSIFSKNDDANHNSKHLDRKNKNQNKTQGNFKTDETYYNNKTTIKKNGNYKNYSEGYDYNNPNQSLKKGKIIKKKNYDQTYYEGTRYEHFNNYQKYDNNEKYDNYEKYDNNEKNDNYEKYDKSYNYEKYNDNYNYQNKWNNKNYSNQTKYSNYPDYKTVETHLTEKETKSITNSNYYPEISNSKKAFVNKFDNLLQKDSTNNFAPEHNVISTPINISDFVNKLNINAKEFVPRNLINSQPQHQR